MPLGYDCAMTCGRSSDRVIAGVPLCADCTWHLMRMALQQVWDRQEAK